MLLNHEVCEGFCKEFDKYDDNSDNFYDIECKSNNFKMGIFFFDYFFIVLMIILKNLKIVIINYK